MSLLDVTWSHLGRHPDRYVALPQALADELMFVLTALQTKGRIFDPTVIQPPDRSIAPSDSGHIL